MDVNSSRDLLELAVPASVTRDDGLSPCQPWGVANCYEIGHSFVLFVSNEGVELGVEVGPICTLKK